MAVKKSSRTLRRYSNVGRLSGFSVQQCFMISYRSPGQLSGQGMRYPLSRFVITSGFVIPERSRVTVWEIKPLRQNDSIMHFTKILLYKVKKETHGACLLPGYGILP